MTQWNQDIWVDWLRPWEKYNFIQEIKIPLGMLREEINELGRIAPYTRYPYIRDDSYLRYVARQEYSGYRTEIGHWKWYDTSDRIIAKIRSSRPYRPNNLWGVCVSGYFNPTHKGHLELIAAADEIAYQRKEPLIVIVNNDRQVKLKGSCPFMKEAERLDMVFALRGVSDVYLSLDIDRTVAYSLRLIRPSVFVNSGDVQTSNEQEAEACNEIGCEIEFVKLPKIQGSRDLTKKAHDWHSDQIWKNRGF